MNLQRYNWHTSVIPTSTKKLKSIASEIKYKNLQQIISMCSVSNKRIAYLLLKSFKCIANNISNYYNIKIDDVLPNCYVSFAVVERKKIHRSGIRYKARGSASIARTRLSCLNIYMNITKTKNNNQNV